MATANYQGVKFCDRKAKNITDVLAVEEALQIEINNEPFTVTMRTPGNDLELIRGLLFSEDVYTDKDNPLNVIVKGENDQGILTKVNLIIDEKQLGKGYLNSRSLLSVASCGICGKTELGEMDLSNLDSYGDKRIEIDHLYDMFIQMNKNQPTFESSGGSHAAAAFDQEGKMLSVMEDIGRHNAVDKVIGELLEKRTIKDAVCMVVSGRVSYEIIIKAFRAKIPILAAVSAPSTLSVDFAKELNITLLGFCRESKATCYAHPERIIVAE